MKKKNSNIILIHISSLFQTVFSFLAHNNAEKDNSSRIYICLPEYHG